MKELSNYEKAKIWKAVEKKLSKPKTRTGQILFELAELSFALQQVQKYKYQSIDDILKIGEKSRACEEYYKMKAALERLKKNKLVKAQKTANSFMVALTDAGFMEVVRKNIISCEDCLPDGTYCYVVFDIPESVRSSRLLLRRLLKQAKFNMIQQSVWRSDRDLAELLVVFVHYAGVAKWVRVIKGSDMMRELFLQK